MLSFSTSQHHIHPSIHSSYIHIHIHIYIHFDMFTFTPLLGARTNGSRAQQSILELDGGIKILVDLGWDSSFDVADLKPLER